MLHTTHNQSLPFHITAIPAFQDNYLWLMHHPTTQQAIVVDPGDAHQVIKALEQLQLNLFGIFITHKHADHIGGVQQLKEQFPEVHIWAMNAHSFLPKIPIISVENGSVVELHCFEKPVWFEVMHTPGHMQDHICFYEKTTPLLFCGDTLFSAGCGRIFDGSYEEMFNSLKKIQALPTETLIFCAHEYTLSNLKFAQMVEPDNLYIQNKIKEITEKRAVNLISLPSTLEVEHLINPFLRTNIKTVQNNIELHTQIPATANAFELFKKIREWKNTI